MGEPVTTAGGGWLAGKIIPPLLGFMGASLMLVFTRELDWRRMLVAVGFGVLSAWLAPPLIVGALRHSAGISWLPTDGSLEGLLGLLLGLGSINFVAYFLRVSKDPAAAVQEIKNGGKDA